MSVPLISSDVSLHREIALLKESLTAQITASDRVTAQRFDAVEKQLQVADRYRVEQKTDTATMTQAALAAAEKAVQLQTTASSVAIAKSEAFMVKQIEQMFSTFTSALGSVIEKVNALGVTVAGMAQHKVGGNEMKASFFGVAGFIGALLVVASYLVGKG